VVEVDATAMTKRETRQAKRIQSVIFTMADMVDGKALYIRECDPVLYDLSQATLARDIIQSGIFWLECIWTGVKHHAQRRK
jgi:hypothetical protein